MAADFSGTMRKGQFVPDDPVRFAGWSSRHNGKRVRASFRLPSYRRTMSQNRYYWGVVLATLAEWCGHEPEELHEYLRDALLNVVERELPTGELLKVHPSTATLTVEQFSGYVDRVVRWAAEQGCYVPDAHEVSDA